MSMLGKMGDMYKLQSEAKKIKKELAKTHVFAEVKGVKVTVNGEMEMMSIEVDDDANSLAPAKLNALIIEAANKALKKAQSVAAEKMQAVMGGLKGLMG